MTKIENLEQMKQFVEVCFDVIVKKMDKRMKVINKNTDDFCNDLDRLEKRLDQLEKKKKEGG